MKAKKKRGVEAPPKVKAFINSVQSTPLANIQNPLAGFHWDYDKGDFYHWVELLNHFEVFFETFIKPRKDLQLEGNFLEGDDPFPKEAVLQILRVTQIILENCANKYLYNSNEHVSSLFASTDPDIVVAALQTLAAFVKKPVQSNRGMRWHGDAALNACLFSLSQGWGGKEEGLGLLACAIENGCDPDACKLGATLHFEFYAEGGDASHYNHQAKSTGLQVIHICDLHRRSEGDLELLRQLVEQYKVPPNLRFMLLTRLRFARAFVNLSLRRQYICIRLLAFTVLLQSSPDHEDLTAFFINEPEFVDELVSLLRCEETVPEDIRILALLALAAQTQDRPRQSNILTVISAGGHRGILPSLMQKAIGSIMAGTPGYSVSFVEALLSLVTVLVSSSTGAAALREAGLIPTILPLLQDMDPQHNHLVTAAVHNLEAFMDYSNPAGTLFRDLGGLDDAVARLKVEVARIEEWTQRRRAEVQVDINNVSPMVEDMELQQQSASGQSDTFIPYHQRLLLKALLRAIALGTYAPDNARLHRSEESALPACLCIIFRNAKEFGGGVFSLAASVMSDLIHKDPTCFSALNAAGLPAAFLDAIATGVLPSSEAVGCIPNSLDALCLNNAGLQAVRDRNALGCFVKIFTSKAYLRALTNDTPGSLASGIDELMRHAPSLRGAGIDMCIGILKTIAVIGGAAVEPTATDTVPELDSASSPIPMDTDAGEKSGGQVIKDNRQQNPAPSQQSSNPASDGATPNVEAFLSECINNTVRLLETLLQNADSSRVFIEKKGIEALLQLYTLPHLPVSFGGSSTAHNMAITFRSFSPQHSAALARVVCTGMREHLKVALHQLPLMSGRKLSDLDSGLQNKVARSLGVVECYLTLSTVLVRSSSAMMAELSTATSDVLQSIGKIQREVFWQISMLDNVKVDVEEVSRNHIATSVGVGTGSGEGEDETDSYPVVRSVNQVQLRNSPSSHWGLEPDFLPILHGGDGPFRHSRRDHAASAEALTQMARMGQLARHAESIQLDLEAVASLAEPAAATESAKQKSPESLNLEMMERLSMAARSLYIALGKVMVVPSRRRDDTVPLSAAAKSVAATLAILLRDNLSFNGNEAVLQKESYDAVKCRYRGKVVDDISELIFDSRRRTCNNFLVNNLVGHGAIQQILTTFGATTQQLWIQLQNSKHFHMETESTQSEGERTGELHSWLVDTLQNYSRLLEHLVTSSLLLTPASMAQMLICPVSGVSDTVAKDPATFVGNLQAQVLDVVLPVWNHAMFPHCNAAFINSVVAIITHIYTGVGHTKGSRTQGVSGGGLRLIGPPPDESSVSRIVEMGFSRTRAEEALRHVDSNSVEMAMEWLFSHPEEAPQEDDELAQALAMSLNNDGLLKADARDGNKGKEVVSQEEGPRAPSIVDMLSTCVSLLQKSDVAAFSLADLLVTMCNRNKGRDRLHVVSFLAQQLKSQRGEASVGDNSALSTIAHTLALVLNEDSTAREVAAENGLVCTALEILESFTPVRDAVKPDVPKWVTALLLVLDHMLQYKGDINVDASGGSAATVAGSSSVALSSEESPSEGQRSEVDNVQQQKNGDPFGAILGNLTGYMTDDEQCKAVAVATGFLHMQLPSATVQAVLQLCARLTKKHNIAMQFLDAGGLTVLLGLPRRSMFPGFDSLAASIIRHILEDPHTLQQAMESEIRHTLITSLSRQNGRLSPRMFLTAMAPVVSRNPTIFMLAASTVCQIEMVGGRPTVIMAKEKEQEKENDKDKEHEKNQHIERVQDKQLEKPKTAALCVSSETGAATDGGMKAHELSRKSGKVHHHKKIPHSFSQVIDQLLEVILHYPLQVLEQPGDKEQSLLTKEESIPMDVDDLRIKDKGKGQAEDGLKPSGTETDSDISEDSAALAKVTFVMKLTTEVLLMYASAVSVVLRRDSESSQGRGPSQGGAEVIGHGGLLYHVLQRLLSYPEVKPLGKKNDKEWREKLSDKAAYFLMAVCVRSGQGRRRVVVEIVRALTSACPATERPNTEPSKGVPQPPPGQKLQALVDLVNSILSSHAPAANAQGPGFSSFMAKTMMDAGMVQALTHTLQAIDLDHPDTPKLVNSILKALEILTRACSSIEQVFRADGGTQKRVTGGRGAEQRIPVVNEALDADVRGAEGSQAQTSQQTQESLSQEALPHDATALLPVGSVDNHVEEQMEHDRADRGTSEEAFLEVEAEAEEEFMREAAEDVAAEMAYGLEPVAGDEIADEEDDEVDMDDGDGEDNGEEEDEDEEEDDDEDDMEGDEGVPHLSPHDTDVEDHDDNGLGDEYEDMVEEDEDDDWQEDRVIEVRWRDGLTGLNRVQVLGHTGASNLVDFSGDPFQGLNMDDLFGSSRRPGGGDRRRAATYRALAERYSGGDRGVAFHHPLLTRPATTPGMGGSTISGLANNSLLAGTGSVGREAEAALGGGALDVTHLYMYDGAMLEHPAEGVFGERGVGAPPPPLLDFSMDPVYLFGRRGGRPDGRLNSWVDDGQLQAGAQATAVAQAIEEQFISQLRMLVPGEGHPLANPPADNTTSAGVESTEARVAAATETLVEGVEPDASTQTTDNSEERAHGSDTVVGASNVEAENASTGSGIRLRLEREELVPGSNVMDDADVQMHDERSDRVVRDAEGGSQDSGGSGATVGESLRSLEVEIGSADGHEDGERHAGAERLGAPEVQPQGGVDSDASRDRRAEQAGVVNGDMEGAGIVGQQVDDAEETEAGPGVSFGQVEVASIGVQGDGHAASTGQHDGEDATVSSIDPTFLEALPADLRAEVLASRQTLAARPPNPPPPPAEEIDPEFLAALPPDIQAEVLAQQRAPRAVIAAIEAQPVDMDSASIIATFPAELRQEVLLTSSEAVLAALPPALLAEAQLLRERAMSQYQARGLFGGAHRIRHRQNSLGIGGGTETAALDRAVGVGAGTGITVGHRPLTPSSSTRIKEDEGSPLVDTDALKAILRLIRLAQPLGKGLLQRLLLNLCAHSVTRVTLLQLLLDMLCPEAEGGSREGCCTDGGQSQRLYGCNWNVVYARSQLSDGVPPLVSRRVLEILTYLARSLPIVNNVLLYMEPVGRSSSDLSDTSPPKVTEKGKGKLVDGFVPAGAMQESRPKGEIPLILLLKLLNQPLYSRSSAHLEQVMGLLEVVTTHAGAQVGTKAKAQMAADARPPASSVSDTPASISDLAAVAVTSATADGGSSQPEGLSSTPSDTVRTAGTGTEGGDGTEPSISGSDFKVDTAAILLSLPEQELRNLCKLLAREGLSDTAYTRVAEVLKKLATAAPPHRRLFVADLADAARSLSDPAIEELCSLGDVDGVVASRTSMAGAAMLRVLQALSALTSSAGSASEKDKGQGNSGVSNMEQEEGMMLVRELNGALDVLWHALSVCIGKIEGRLGNVVSLSTPAATAATAATVIGTGMESLAPSLPPGTQRVLPFVEAFFLLCEKLRSGPPPTGRHELNSATARESKEAEASSSGDLGLSMPSTTTLQQKKSEGEKGMTFTRFADRHRRLLNAFVRQNPGLLEKSLGLMLETPRLIDFDNKRAYFRSRIRQQHEQQHYAPLRICVRRAYLLEDSYNQLRMRTPDELKGRLTVQFQGEEGIDAGGLTREWYQLLSRVTFDKGALLFTTVGNESTFQPNPNSVYQTEHLSYFKFVGRVVAKALFDGQLLDVYFTRSFYKHILGVKVTYHDIEAIDPDYFKNLKWMLENDITDILDLTFSMDADEEKHILYEKTEVTDYELIPGGCNIRVTEENKHEYVDRVAEHRLTTAIRPQITAFLEGFNELVAHELISIFNDKEMELLISGLPEIDLEDLKANTEYTGYTAASPIVQWFWDVVGTFNKEDMARLLQFITGTSKVPLEGFRALQGISGPQRFQIHKAYGAPERLPSAHTCFNQLDLPDYASKEQLQERLLLAIHEGSEGFGFG